MSKQMRPSDRGGGRTAGHSRSWLALRRPNRVLSDYFLPAALAAGAALPAAALAAGAALPAGALPAAALPPAALPAAALPPGAATSSPSALVGLPPTISLRLPTLGRWKTPLLSS